MLIPENLQQRVKVLRQGSGDAFRKRLIVLRRMLVPFKNRKRKANAEKEAKAQLEVSYLFWELDQLLEEDLLRRIKTLRQGSKKALNKRIEVLRRLIKESKKQKPEVNAVCEAEAKIHQKSLVRELDHLLTLYVSQKPIVSAPASTPLTSRPSAPGITQTAHQTEIVFPPYFKQKRRNQFEALLKMPRSILESRSKEYRLFLARMDAKHSLSYSQKHEVNLMRYKLELIDAKLKCQMKPIPEQVVSVNNPQSKASPLSCLSDILSELKSQCEKAEKAEMAWSLAQSKLLRASEELKEDNYRLERKILSLERKISNLEEEKGLLEKEGYEKWKEEKKKLAERNARLEAEEEEQDYLDRQDIYNRFKSQSG